MVDGAVKNSDKIYIILYIIMLYYIDNALAIKTYLIPNMIIFEVAY